MSTVCKFPGCTCERFEGHKWVADRCLCMHKRNLHSEKSASDSSALEKKTSDMLDNADFNFGISLKETNPNMLFESLLASGGGSLPPPMPTSPPHQGPHVRPKVDKKVSLTATHTSPTNSDDVPEVDVPKVDSFKKRETIAHPVRPSVAFSASQTAKESLLRKQIEARQSVVGSSAAAVAASSPSPPAIVSENIDSGSADSASVGTVPSSVLAPPKQSGSGAADQTIRQSNFGFHQNPRRTISKSMGDEKGILGAAGAEFGKTGEGETVTSSNLFKSRATTVKSPPALASVDEEKPKERIVNHRASLSFAPPEEEKPKERLGFSRASIAIIPSEDGGNERKIAPLTRQSVAVFPVSENGLGKLDTGTPKHSAEPKVSTAPATMQKSIKIERFSSEEDKRSASNTPASSIPGTPRHGGGGSEESKGEKIEFTTMESYLLRMLPKLEAGQLYASRLKGSEPIVLTQLLAGLESVKRMSEFYKELAAIERTYRKSLQTLVDKENETALSSVHDRMASTNSAWIGLLKAVGDQAAAHQDVERHLHQSIVQNLERFFETSMTQFENIAVEHESLSAALRTLRDNIRLSKDKCVQNLEQFLHPGSTSALTKAFMKLSGGEASAKKSAYEFCSKYDDAVSNANQFLFTQKTLYLPMLLSKMQALEERRVQLQQVQIQGYADLLHSLHQSLTPVRESMQTFADCVSVSKDIEGFSCHVEGDASAMAMAEVSLAPFVYDLPMSLNQIRRKMGVKSSAVIDIRTSISSLVEQERKYCADQNLQLPRVFTCLKRAIEDLGGLQCEGIFRVPGDFVETNQILEQVAENDFELAIKTSHNAASALKKWLRELQEPLIPEKHYKLIEEVCVELSSLKDKKPYHQKPLKNKLVSEVFDTLEPVEKLLIKGIVRLIRDISHEPNVKINKMTVSNLALIFGPIFINPKDRMDAKVLMNLANFGATFVEVLAQDLSTSDYPVHEEDITKSKLIKPIKNYEEWPRSPWNSL